MSRTHAASIELAIIRLKFGYSVFVTDNLIQMSQYQFTLTTFILIQKFVILYKQTIAAIQYA